MNSQHKNTNSDWLLCRISNLLDNTLQCNNDILKVKNEICISCQMVFIIVKKFILKNQKFCSNTEIDEIQNKILTCIISNTANKLD